MLGTKAYVINSYLIIILKILLGEFSGSLVVGPWCFQYAMGLGSIQGTKIHQAVWLGQKKKKILVKPNRFN